MIHEDICLPCDFPNDFVAEIQGFCTDVSGFQRLPSDGEYGEGVVASVTIVTDGMRWIEQYVVAKFRVAVVMLDAYHVLERLRKQAEARHGKKSAAAAKLYDDWVRLLLGKPSEKGSRKRKPSKKEKQQQARERPTPSDRPPWLEVEMSCQSTSAVEVLIENLTFEDGLNKDQQDDQDKLIDYLDHNQYRMNYLLYRRRGYQIGSGAMESLHRNGSQIRLKLPGPGWLEESSQAIFNLRMLYLCGRWDEFWHQPGLTEQLAKRFREQAEKAAEARAQAA